MPYHSGVYVYLANEDVIHVVLLLCDTVDTGEHCTTTAGIK